MQSSIIEYVMYVIRQHNIPLDVLVIVLVRVSVLVLKEMGLLEEVVVEDAAVLADVLALVDVLVLVLHLQQQLLKKELITTN